MLLAYHSTISALLPRLGSSFYTLAACSIEQERYKESSCSSNRMNVDLAPFKNLFPQSITFDCYCTKRKVVNIRESLLGGGSFCRDCISKCEAGKRKCNVEHQSDMAECICNIGFHIMNPWKSFSCYSHKGLIRQVIGSQANVNISPSIRIMWHSNQRGAAFQMV